jgi:hypothetical protein
MFVLGICLLSYHNLDNKGELAMNPKISNERLLDALKNTPESQRLDRKVHNAIEKISKGKKLKSHEFHEIHALLFKSGPSIKYSNPEKWERITREFAARNHITQ